MSTPTEPTGGSTARRGWNDRRAALGHRAERIWAVIGGRRDVLFVARCLRLFVSIDARDRILMLAGQGFIALVPALIVVASVTTAAGADRVGEDIVERFSLTVGAADGVRTLFAHPPGTAGVTLLSLLLLLFSLNGFARSVQRVFESAWQLQRCGLRGTLHRAVGVLVLLGAGTVAGRVGHLMDGAVALVLVGLVVQFGVVVAGWLGGTWLMLSQRRRPRELLLGAVLGATIEIGAGWGTAIYLPALFQSNAERYGVIGVALTLVTWLVAVATVIVTAAIGGAVLGTEGDPQLSGFGHLLGEGVDSPSRFPPPRLPE